MLAAFVPGLYPPCSWLTREAVDTATTMHAMNSAAPSAIRMIIRTRPARPGEHPRSCMRAGRARFAPAGKRANIAASPESDLRS